MILGVTGHRLHYFQCNPDHIRQRLYDMAVAVLKYYQPIQVISGMEPTGWDYAVARAAQTLELPLIAAIPFPSHAQSYPQLAGLGSKAGDTLAQPTRLLARRYVTVNTLR